MQEAHAVIMSKLHVAFLSIFMHAKLELEYLGYVNPIQIRFKQILTRSALPITKRCINLLECWFSIIATFGQGIVTYLDHFLPSWQRREGRVSYGLISVRAHSIKRSDSLHMILESVIMQEAKPLAFYSQTKVSTEQKNCIAMNKELLIILFL